VIVNVVLVVLHAENVVAIVAAIELELIERLDHRAEQTRTKASQVRRDVLDCHVSHRDVI